MDNRISHSGNETSSDDETEEADLNIPANNKSGKSIQSRRSAANVFLARNSAIVAHNALPSRDCSGICDFKRFGWNIIEGLHGGDCGSIEPHLIKDDAAISNLPPPLEATFPKRRRWPMKGWHKRYVRLEAGILSYAKNSVSMSRGRLQGTVDTAMAVICYQADLLRIEIDSDSSIHHFKLKDKSCFEQWINALQQHRIHRQAELSNSIVNKHHLAAVNKGGENSLRVESDKNDINSDDNFHRPETLSLIEKDLQACQASVDQLAQIHEEIRRLAVLCPLNSTAATNTASLEVCPQSLSLSCSNPNLAVPPGSSTTTTTTAAGRSSSPHSGAARNSLVDRSLNPVVIRKAISSVTRGHKRSSTEVKISKFDGAASDFQPSSSWQENQARFLEVAKNVVDQFRILTQRIQQECILSQCEIQPQNTAHILNETLMVSNVDPIVNRLTGIRDEIDQLIQVRLPSKYPLSDLEKCSEQNFPTTGLKLLMSPASLDLDENFFDAEDHFSQTSISDQSNSEASEAESVESETEAAPLKRKMTILEETTGRRDRLPVPRPDTSDFNLFHHLRKNIGRDLSRVRMPVTVHEPLSLLQKICEELEYSELLDLAAEQKCPLERMTYVAAFAVSGYASFFYRAATKPFNPLLGETFEYIREDKGWKFLAEQISHHPPVTAVHCSHAKWTWFQELRLKNKFWGKSIEALPIGKVHVHFPELQETYSWNKVTTCISNLFSSQRSTEHYGDMFLTLAGQSEVSCQLKFHRVTSSWAGGAANEVERYQVSGRVSSSATGQEVNLFGRWNEALYAGRETSVRCVWRPGAMPADQAAFYGFTRFAIDLNSVSERLTAELPRTDSRFRPDQRHLENGELDSAEQAKLRVEELQRARIGQLPDGKEENWRPVWFRKSPNSSSDLTHEFTGQYWKIRSKEGGSFDSMDLPILW